MYPWNIPVFSFHSGSMTSWKIADFHESFSRVFPRSGHLKRFLFVGLYWYNFPRETEGLKDEEDFVIFMNVLIHESLSYITSFKTLRRYIKFILFQKIEI